MRVFHSKTVAGETALDLRNEITKETLKHFQRPTDQGLLRALLAAHIRAPHSCEVLATVKVAPGMRVMPDFPNDILAHEHICLFLEDEGAWPFFELPYAATARVVEKTPWNVSLLALGLMRAHEKMSQGKPDTDERKIMREVLGLNPEPAMRTMDS